MDSLYYLSHPMPNCLARALYDNLADSPDELAFRKGDILVVLEQNTNNIEGWWLCSLRGRQGICPGNRLRLIPGVFEDTGQGREPSPQLTEISDMNSLQRQGKRRSWHVQPNKVVTPKKYNDVYLYDMPPSRCSPVSIPTISPNISPREQNNDCYDVPPRAVPLSVEQNRNCPRCSPAPSCVSPVSRDSRDSMESYDVPRPLFHQQNQLTPSSSASSLTADSFSSSNRSSVVNMPDYDIPRPLNRGPQLLLQPTQLYDVPPPHQPPQLKELPLELNSALETLEKLQSETTSAISKLLSFVMPQWRTSEKLDSNIMEIRLAVERLRTSLHDLAEFSEGALGNAGKASDKNLSTKLSPLVVALRNSDRLVNEAADKLNQIDWSVNVLCRQENDKSCKLDELEQLVACSKALTEDVRQATSFIQGNSTLLFKKDTSPNINNNSEWLEDYDYVNLESKDTTAKKHAEIRDCLPQKLKKDYDTMIKNVHDVSLNNEKPVLDHDEKQILTFFATQVITHHNNLTQAIDAFLQTVEHNQPPKVFLAHGKFVVLSAHKLVHIGDTVHRNISQTELKAHMLKCANTLFEALATSVTKTKIAAQQFPNIAAVQEMVDSIVDISHCARDLKLCLIQAAQP
ncbi:cas scaffolding protein [Holotrichia oblita]|uniref:Cas scaffolding protein n=2 Tax=Holotrichia oblita TaxID=644536 RepID=A0ACB9TSS8_HOLOL|nr:cas scaffolding protein [Holotrichia oblita]